MWRGRMGSEKVLRQPGVPHRDGLLRPNDLRSFYKGFWDEMCVTPLNVDEGTSYLLF